MISEQIKRMRYFAGLGPQPDEPDPNPAAHAVPIALPEQTRARELALLDRQQLERPPLTEGMRTARRLAGLSETYQDSPPAVALKGASAFIAGDSNRGDISAPIDGYYSSGRESGGGRSLVQPGGQSAPVHPLTDPDPEAGALSRLQQAADVVGRELRLGKGLYRAATKFCFDQASFAVELAVDSWISAPDSALASVLDALNTSVVQVLADALDGSGELSLGQTRQLALDLETAIAALQAEEVGERTVTKRPALFEQAVFEATHIKEQPDGKVRIRGIVQRAGVRNKNSRVYSHKLLVREVSAMQKRLRDGEVIYAGLDHPAADGIARLSNAAAIWKDVSIGDDGIVRGEAELLGTPAGKTVAEILRGTGKIGASSRGYGTTTVGENQEQRVSDDFNLVSFDFIDGPSTPGAFLEPIQ